jgi:bifunctional UDP-N-acetylglucosamine pyrophosphorylase/glucosamine-1-phosphate N-acetyltransferase
MTTRRCTMILAAGQGTRMKSMLPKVLHAAAGAPLIVWAIEAARDAGADSVVVVVGHGREAVVEAVRARFGASVRFAVQTEQRGTADAVRAGMSEVDDDVSEVVITYGDVPCVPAEALRALSLARAARGAHLALMTTEVLDPRGYGRILRDARGSVVAIREHKDCTDAERLVRTVNPGLYAVERAFLASSLGRISSQNAQGEFYLTDLVALAAHASPDGVAEVPWEPTALRGVNDRAELASVEASLYERIADRHRRAGCSIATGARIDHDVTLEAGASVGPGTVLRGRTSVAAGASIDAGCVLDDAVIGPGATLKPYCVVARSEVGLNAQVGPFAHVRPESVLEEGAHVGNFVELKKTRLGAGAKANHLAYLGDGVVGAGANIGAGTIFCNYDGVQKHTTRVGEGAFVGSNSSLVAPVTIGRGAYVGSGSVITRDVPDDALAVGRARQEIKPGYGARLRERFAAAKRALQAAASAAAAAAKNDE